MRLSTESQTERGGRRLVGVKRNLDSEIEERFLTPRTPFPSTPLRAGGMTHLEWLVKRENPASEKLDVDTTVE